VSLALDLLKLRRSGGLELAEAQEILLENEGTVVHR